jgi:hypothetical protein
MRWVQTWQGAWVLSLGDGFVRLERGEGDRWDVHCLDTGAKPGYYGRDSPWGMRRE